MPPANAPSLQKIRHDRPLRHDHQSDAIEDIGRPAKAGKTSLRVAGQPNFDESRAVASRESRGQNKNRSPQALSSRRAAPCRRSARPFRDGENPASSMQSPRACSLLFIFVPRMACFSRTSPLAVKGSEPGHWQRRLLHCIRRARSPKTRAGLVHRKERRRCLALCPIPSATKIIPGNQSYFFGAPLFCRRTILTVCRWPSQATGRARASKFVIKVLR